MLAFAYSIYNTLKVCGSILHTTGVADVCNESKVHSRCELSDLGSQCELSSQCDPGLSSQCDPGLSSQCDPGLSSQCDLNRKERYLGNYHGRRDLKKIFSVQ